MDDLWRQREDRAKYLRESAAATLEQVSKSVLSLAERLRSGPVDQASLIPMGSVNMLVDALADAVRSAEIVQDVGLARVLARREEGGS